MSLNAADRPAWFASYLSFVPLLVSSLHEQLHSSRNHELTERVTGTKTRTTTPMAVDRLDDLDNLWSVLWALVDDVAERTNSTPPTCRSRQHLTHEAGLEVVRGYKSIDPRSITADTTAVLAWLRSRAWPIALNPHYREPLDELATLIDRLRSRAQLTNAQKAGLCRICGQRTVIPINTEQHRGWICTHCENQT
ncbi:hypothetical protein [Leucobacter musarum]|uniref:hypothetical protein n=1 Tax=Leucobacter musarum TaxID=1930747 RepID=UPI0006A7A5AA|nr:hypothetical protein [Leucobacter musarum]